MRPSPHQGIFLAPPPFLHGPMMVSFLSRFGIFSALLFSSGLAFFWHFYLFHLRRAVFFPIKFSLVWGAPSTLCLSIPPFLRFVIFSPPSHASPLFNKSPLWNTTPPPSLNRELRLHNKPYLHCFLLTAAVIPHSPHVQ